MYIHIVWALIAIALLVIGRVTGFRRGQTATFVEGNELGLKVGRDIGFRDGMDACEGTIIDLRNQLGRLKDREGLYLDRITDLHLELYATEQALAAPQGDSREEVARRTEKVSRRLKQLMAEAKATGG